MLASEWINVAEEVSIDGPVVDVETPIPDGDPISGVVSTVEILESILAHFLFNFYVCKIAL